MKSMIIGAGIALALAGMAAAQDDVRAPAAGTATPKLAAPVRAPAAAPRVDARVAPANVVRATGLKLRPVSELVVLSELTRAQYLTAWQEYFAVLDKNGDGELAWQGTSPAEPLPPATESCAIVNYEFVPASKTKDPKAPGKWIETAAGYTPNGWVAFAEALADVSVQSNECLAYSDKSFLYCDTGEGDTSGSGGAGAWIPSLPSSSAGYSPKPPIGSCWFGSCKSQQKTLEQECAEAGGEVKYKSGEKDCESWYQFGPKTEEGLLAVAELMFKTEDHDGNGRISAKEGAWLCTPWAK